MKRVAVFCGSRLGRAPCFATAVKGLGHALALEKLGLVYGGANLGLMGLLADAALAAGANVVGVMPHELIERERAHQGLDEFHAVDTMHERKALMAKMCDAVVLCPGGGGSLDEFFEMFTWRQLAYHDKPLALLNTAGYFDGLIAFLDHAVQSGFIEEAYREALIIKQQPQALVTSLKRVLFS